MDLQSWLETGHSKRSLARRAGVTWRVIHKVARGHVPRLNTARKISAATGGEVSVAELLQLDADERPEDPPFVLRRTA